VWAATAGAGIGAVGSATTGLAEATTVVLAGLLGILGWTVSEGERQALLALSAAAWAAIGAFGLGYAKTETVR
jgi:hypothetical protein